MRSLAALLLATLSAPSRAVQNGSTPALPGTNVIVTADEVIYEASSHLPDLKAETRSISYGAIANGAFDGIINVGATLSLDEDNKFYAYGVAVRNSLSMFLDLVNYEKGGITVQGKRYGLRFTWFGDGGNSKQVTNATAHASRTTDADFLFAGYASGYTTNAVKQSYAEGKLIMCGGAATPSVYSQNNLSFGFFPPGPSYTANALLAIAEKAAALDASGVTDCGLELEDGAAAQSCVAKIKIGLLQADASFTITMCDGAADNAAAAGLAYVTDADGAALRVTVPSTPTDAEMLAALTTLQAAGVTLIVGCTYAATGTSMLNTLEAMDYAPLQVTMSSTLDTDAYISNVAAGWWQGQYALGYATWHRSSAVRGAYSGMTSEEFASAYEARYDGMSVPYQGTAQFAAGCALADAIETADSLDTEAVAAALRAQDLTEFYAQLKYDEWGQLDGDLVVLQYPPASTELKLVYPPQVSTGAIVFPTPGWALRRCRAESVDASDADGLECHGHGACNVQGTCDCDDGYEGTYCLTPSLEVEYNYLPKALVYAAWAVNFLLYLAGVIFAVWTYRNRNTRLVSSSQPVFLYLIILGSFISLAAVFPLAMDHDGRDPELRLVSNDTNGTATYEERYPDLDIACNSIAWLYAVGFVLSFGSLFAKLWRAKMILVNPSLRNIKISNASLVVRIGVMLLVECALLLGWTLTDPMYFKVETDAVDKYDRVTESHGHCVTGSTGLGFLFAIIGMNLLLLLYGNVLVYQARKVPTRYNEGKYISFCAANNLQTTLFAVLLAVFVYDAPIAFFIIKWIALISCDAGTLLLIFVPKLIFAQFGGTLDELNTKTSGSTTSAGLHTVAGGPADNYRVHPDMNTSVQPFDSTQRNSRPSGAPAAAPA